MKIKENLLLLALGSLYALGFPNIINSSFLITPIIAITGLFLTLFKEKRFKCLVVKFLIFAVGFNLTGYYWIAETLTEFGHIPYILSLLINSLFSLIIMPYMWIVVTYIYFLNKRGDFKVNSGLQVTLLSISLTLIEYFTPQQFDSFLGSPWIEVSEYLGFASLSGVAIYSFFSFLIVFEIIHFIHSKRISKLNCGFILVFIIANPFLSNKVQTSSKTTNFNLRVVQANISNFLKVESEKGGYATSSQVIEKYRDLSNKPYTQNKDIDLIIWPETAYPFSVNTDKIIEETLIPIVWDEVVKFNNTDLITGGYESKHTESFYLSDYNTAFHINSDGKLVQTYNKKILIPFGETLPFGSFNKYLSKYLTNISFFASGEKFTVFNLKKDINAISTICYEILKPEFIREYLNSIDQKAHFMINITNDSWYGDTMEPYQHLFLSKWRALEFNIPIVRSTNTGITSVIYPNGLESVRSGLFKEENLDITLELKDRQSTIYQRFGLSFLYVIMLLLVIFQYLGFKNEK